MRAPITDKHLLEMMWDRFPEIMKRGIEQPAQQEPVAGKKSRTSADNYGASYETSDRAPFTDGDPSDGY